MLTSPWPMRVGGLLLCEADATDIERLLAFRNDAGVNRFMIRTHVDPDTFRRDWLAIRDSDTDFSCVAELDGVVVAMGFLEVTDGTGQPGMPRGTDGRIAFAQLTTAEPGPTAAASPPAAPSVAGAGRQTVGSRCRHVTAYAGVGRRSSRQPECSRACWNVQ